MLEFRLNSGPLPSTIVAGVAYTVTVYSDGLASIPLQWSVSVAGSVIFSGVNSTITFTPQALAAHTVFARITGEFGLPQDACAVVNVVARTGVAEAGVHWSKLLFSEGEPVTAKINAVDSKGLPPAQISWSLFRNSQPILSGAGALVSYVGSTAGIYRLRGTANTPDGQLAFDSTVTVGSGVNGRPSLPLPDNGGTQVYLGAVFSRNLAINSGVTASLPYQTGSSTEDIFLLPGTTHWSFDLDPASGPVDDELVVRTQKGNWCLNGFSGGLTGEDVGYDYGYAPVMIPAPLGKALRLTIDLFKVHGTAYAGSSARLRIKCYCWSPQAVYSYSKCGSTVLPGGLGYRARRWAALFTGLDVQTDVFSGLNRLGSAPNTVSYTTDATTSVPLMTLSNSGCPHPVPGYSGLYHTDSNLYAIYEAEGLPDLEAHALSAIEGLRPCCISLQMFDGSKPIISNRSKRLSGQLAIFLLEGSVTKGSVVYVTVSRAGGVYSSTYALPVMTTAYANADDTLLSIGMVTLNLSDFQFDETGIAVSFTVNEAQAAPSPLPAALPTPVAAPATINSTTYANTVLFDGACYTQPVYVPVLAADAVVVSTVGGCQDTACGQPALYCYSAVDTPSGNVYVTQPFGLPAPYVALASDPARCFQNPAPQVLINGTEISTAPYAGTLAFNLLAYSGTTLCGYSYGYNDCQTSYAPCAGYACSIVVVYPVSSSPHGNVEYGGRCYAFAGSTTAYGTRAVVPAASVTPASGCNDPICNQYNASGSVVVYNDTQTSLAVPVRFYNISGSLPHYGVAPQVQDNWAGGLNAGQATAAFGVQADAVVYTSVGTGGMEFNLGLAGIPKQLVLTRSGVCTVVTANSLSTVLHLLPGDTVSLRIADAYGRLPVRYHNLRATVSWQPLPVLPRLYDIATLAYSGSSAINAIGFCAYTDKGVYSYYGTLPFSGSMTGPVNPDSLVTVAGSNSAEYMLISNRALGDVNVFALENMPRYAGQVLQGPFIFKFYAGREPFGAHGEMDVWLASSGTFPGFLQAGPYASLALSGTYHRQDPAPTDTHRNAYAVSSIASAGTQVWPNVYVAANGQVVSAATGLAGFDYNGVSYAAPLGALPTPDAGLAYSIIYPGAVVSGDTWTTDTGDPWEADSSEPWEVG